MSRLHGAAPRLRSRVRTGARPCGPVAVEDSGGTLRVVQAQVAGGSSLRIPMHYDGYRALGQTKHAEYYDGICVVNPPDRRHVLACMRVARLLDDHRPAGLAVFAEWGWILGPGIELQPDVMVAPTDASGDDQLRVPPLLVVEILSPTTRDIDLRRKMELYGRGGAEWYWVVDLDVPGIVVHRNDGGAMLEVQRHTNDGGTTIGPSPVPVDLAPLLAR